jgi:hypothetical protein
VLYLTYLAREEIKGDCTLYAGDIQGMDSDITIQVSTTSWFCRLSVSGSMSQKSQEDAHLPILITGLSALKVCLIDLVFPFK